MTEKNYMTKEKYRELEEDLKTMQTKGRREIAQKIADDDFVQFLHSRVESEDSGVRSRVKLMLAYV